MQHADFIREIVRNKRDNGPRLIYADYLDSIGHSERAGFIREHIEANRLDLPAKVIKHGRNAGRWEWTHSRKFDLVGMISCVGSHFDVSGIEFVPIGVRRKINGYYIQRGFVSQIDACLEAAMTKLTPVFRSNPVRRLYISDKRPIPVLNGEGGWQWSNRDGQNEASWHLPMELLLLLPTGEGSGCVRIRDRLSDWNSGFSVRDYESEDKAVNALSDAVVAYCERLAWGDMEGQAK